MKIKLTRDMGQFKCGSVVEVGDDDGARLLAEGHERVPDTTPSRKNVDLYGNGCNPLPEAQTTVTTKAKK